MIKVILKHSETIKAVLIIGIIVLITLVLAATLKVHAVRETYHDDMTLASEAEYVDMVKDTLAGFGMNNAGVTLLKTVEPGISVVYTLNIHHALIGSCNAVIRSDLDNSLKAIAAPSRNASVDIRFF